MRSLLLIVSITISTIVTAQVGIGVNYANVEPSAQLEVSSTSKGFLVPRMTSSQRVAIANPASGLLVYQTDAPIGFYYFSQGKWKILAEQDLTLKLNTSDTATMLFGYTRIQRMLDSLSAIQSKLNQKLSIDDTASMLSGYTSISRMLDSLSSVQLKLNLKLNSKDTASLSVRIDQKLNFADTSAMLSNRFARDTASLSSRIDKKLNISDTATMLSNRFARDTVSLSNRIDALATELDTTSLSNRIDEKLNIADTALMLDNRFARDTASLSSRIDLKVNIADTSNMLNPYLRKVDTSAMLSNRFARDTASLSARINSKSSLSDTSLLNLESRFATKLNKTDTASLSNRINAKLSKTDTASLSDRINAKLNSTVIPYAPIIQRGHIMYWNGSIWVLLYPGTAGQVLMMSSGNDPVPVWGTVATTSVPAFSPCGTTISDIDGNYYNTVLIGTQCWTKENLRVRRYNNGTAIQFDATGGSGGSSSSWQNLTIGAHTIYAHDSVATPSNLTKYGYLYNWYAAKGIYTTGTILSNDTLNICPSGWHVPTDAEWTTLTDELGGESVAGGMMKSRGTSYWNSPNTGATNESGFSALPGGFRIDTGDFNNVKLHAYFWSSSEAGSNDAWSRYLSSNDGSVNRILIDKSVGVSVRCIRD